MQKVRHASRKCQHALLPDHVPPFVFAVFTHLPLLRQAIFFGGIDPSIRGEVWPFLLHYYSYDSSSQEREAWRLQKRAHYHDIQQRRWAMKKCYIINQ